MEPALLYPLLIHGTDADAAQRLLTDPGIEVSKEPRALMLGVGVEAQIGSGVKVGSLTEVHATEDDPAQFCLELVYTGVYLERADVTGLEPGDYALRLEDIEELGHDLTAVVLVGPGLAELTGIEVCLDRDAGVRVDLTDQVGIGVQDSVLILFPGIWAQDDTEPAVLRVS